MKTQAEIANLQHLVQQHQWFHSIDLGDGIITPGTKSVESLARESDVILGKIDVNGKSVMDIGASDGGQTVAAARRGAGKIMAIDEFGWVISGRGRFDLVTAVLGLKVETKMVDVHELSVYETGQWDIVLFLGVFYHLIDPVRAIARIAPIVNDVLVIETHLDALEVDRPAMVFYPGPEAGDLFPNISAANRDLSNWWGPNPACVEWLCRTAGFAVVEFVPNPNSPGNRGIFHAWKSEAIRERHQAAIAGQGGPTARSWTQTHVGAHQLSTNFLRGRA